MAIEFNIGNGNSVTEQGAQLNVRRLAEAQQIMEQHAAEVSNELAAHTPHPTRRYGG